MMLMMVEMLLGRLGGSFASLQAILPLMAAMGVTLSIIMGVCNVVGYFLLVSVLRVDLSVLIGSNEDDHRKALKWYKFAPWAYILLTPMLATIHVIYALMSNLSLLLVVLFILLVVQT